MAIEREMPCVLETKILIGTDPSQQCSMSYCKHGGETFTKRIARISENGIFPNNLQPKPKRTPTCGKQIESRTWTSKAW